MGSSKQLIFWTLLLSVSTVNGTIERGTDYDEVNRKVAQRDAVGSDVERAMAWQYDRAGNLLVYIDGRENQQTYQYDDKDRQIFRTNTDDNRFIYQYDDYGNRTDEFDHFGNRIHTDYDELHRPVKVIDQRDFEMSYVYDLLGNPLQETQYNNNVIIRDFDFLNREIVTTDSIGSLMAMSYDDDNNKLSHTDGKGFVTHYQYDALSQQTQQAEPEGRTLLSEYDVFGNVSKTVDGEGNPTALQYDRLNRQIQLTDADSKTILSVYDPVSNKLSETDKRGNTTQWQYDDLDRVILLTEPQAGSHDNKIINRFDANDNLIQSIDKRHIVTDYDYDRLNRVIEERRSGIRVIKNTYSEIGDLIGLEDANGNTTAMEYNQRHEMIVESRPEIAISHYSYDAMGDELNMTDPEGRLMSTTYDLRQRKINHTNGEGETTTYTYDLNNKQTQKTRPEQNTWQYSHDELNRLIQITDAQNAISQHTWDRQNNQLSHTDANGNQTQYEYDVLNRRSVMHYPSTIGQALAICTYTYDPNNNLKVETDANGQIQSHQYDALNRLTNTTYTNPSTSVNRDLTSVAMQYDGNNNETQVTETYKGDTVPNEVRIDQRRYDDFDRLFNRTDSFNKALQYRYDLNGNRTGLTDSDGILTSYTFDGLNRTATVRTNGTTAYQYDRSSLLKTIAYPNNTQASYHYDQAKRILEIHNQQNNATVSKYQYSYDENGNRTEQLEENGAAEQQTTYQYDNNDRLTNVHYDINGATDTQTTYTYDAAYNRTSEIEIQTDLVTQTSTQTKNKTHHYNQRNQLTDIEDHLDDQNNVSYQFDQNGNQTQKTKNTETTDYIYDIRDHLRQVKIGGSTVGQFLYDYDGLRIEKLGERGAERSTYDDQAILQQYDENNTTRAKFDYGPNRLLSLNTTGEPTQFYLTDAIRSVVNLTNDQGAVQARYQYDAWGQKRNEVGTSYNRFSFTGYEEDRETNLQYAKARYYDPDTGRFLGEDAWEGDTQIAPSLHKYLYAFQNPTVWVDPTGNVPVLDEGGEFLLNTGEALIGEAEQADNIPAAVGLGLLAGANYALGGLVETVNLGLNILGTGGYLGEGAQGRASQELDQAFGTLDTIVENRSGIVQTAKDAAIETMQGIANGDPKAIAQGTAFVSGAIFTGKGNLDVNKMVQSTAKAASRTSQAIGRGVNDLLQPSQGSYARQIGGVNLRSGLTQNTANKKPIGHNDGVYPIATPSGVRWKGAETGKFVKAPNKGKTILGHDSYRGAPGYVEVAKSQNANFFRMSDKTFKKWMKEGGENKVWKHNELYLKEALKRGDEIGLGTELQAPGYFSKELEYLLKRGIDPKTLKRYKAE